MINCWYCNKPLVRQWMETERGRRLESLGAFKKRQTCHDNSDCIAELMHYRKLQARIRDAKWYSESPDMAELFTRGIRLITMRSTSR
jgi:hypothetical protein